VFDPDALAVMLYDVTQTDDSDLLLGEVEFVEEQPIPTVSSWGMIVLTLVLLTGLKIRFGRHRAVESAG
jgi:hypothetical protein